MQQENLGINCDDGNGNTAPRLPTVAIVGRPNVGKSALFNALIGKRLSIVHELSGVTRDRVMAPASWKGRHFQLIDTGGLGSPDTGARRMDVWDKHIDDQVEAAIMEADVLIMVSNVQDGVVALDRAVAEQIRAAGKIIILAVNKCDTPMFDVQTDDFATLGFADVTAVSSLHRRNLDVLLNKVTASLPKCDLTEVKDEPFRIAVVGRPNVGKSSLVNVLLGEERVIVNETAGTTRDAIDVAFKLRYRGEEIPAELIDTAGLRKKSKINNAVELFSMMRTREAIERSRLVLFLVEAASNGVTAQDRRIARTIEESGRACIIVANKYDQCQYEYKQPQLLSELRYTLPGMSYAPVVFVSALHNYNISGMLDQIAQLIGLLNFRVSTAVFNRVLGEAFERCSPPVVGNLPFKIYYGSMVGTEPPRFLLFVNYPKHCAANYLAYLQNYLRSAFDFTGLPLRLELRERPKKVASIRTAPSKRRKPAARNSDARVRKSSVRTRQVGKKRKK